MLKPVALIQWSSMTTLISRLKLGKISQILNGKLRSCSFDYTLFGSKIFVFFLGLQRIYFLILYIIVQKTWTLAYFWNKTYNFFFFFFFIFDEFISRQPLSVLRPVCEKSFWKLLDWWMTRSGINFMHLLLFCCL
jgi:hypothetical protein